MYDEFIHINKLAAILSTMNKLLSLTIIFCLFSCKENEYRLENELVKLQIENQKLVDSLNNYKILNVSSLKMLLNTDSKILRLNEDNEINGRFFRFDKLPNYSLYVKSKFTNQKIKVSQNLTEPNFQFNYKPVSRKDTLLEIFVTMEINEKIVTFPGEVKYNVK